MMQIREESQEENQVKIKWAKGVMEQEEGMNHLWIGLGPLPAGSVVEVHVECPAGFYRSPNLTGYAESTDGVTRHTFTGTAPGEVIYEVGVRKEIPYTEAEFRIRIRCTAPDGQCRESVHLTRVRLSREEDFDPELDGEVVARVTALLGPPSPVPQEDRGENETWPYVLIPPLVRSAELSEWEKRYRIDYRIPPLSVIPSVF
ncbi:hypothetical protein ACP26L_22960 [Paenibacillus sp. S-38]|uniref:hypothetical protein n=1 Tax=Paenibacillus sp. S-38 TaxID=3416710 RepID=UPI003CF5F245